MNPPTTLIVAAVTAMNPKVALIQPRSAPAATSDPTSEMPEMAFVADINGVCNSAGTARDHLIADEAGQHEHVQLQEGESIHVVGKSSEFVFGFADRATIAVMLASSRQTGNTSTGNSGGFASAVKMAADIFHSSRVCTMQFRTFDTKQQLAAAAAEDGAAVIRRAVAERGEANIIVATGASQFEVLDALARQRDIAWHRVTGFHLDEYAGLPITHPASFRLYLWQRFISKLPLPLASFHFLDGERDLESECQRVGEILLEHPIDVAFVGIGENGHLAFNDPPADFQTQSPYIVVELDDACRRQQLGEGWFPTFDDVPRRAISMSIQQIMKSKAIVCSVPDRRKAEAVKNSLRGPVYATGSCVDLAGT